MTLVGCRETSLYYIPWERMESRFPTHSSLVKVGVRAQIFLCCLDKIEQLSSKSSPFCQSALSPVLWLEIVCFRWAFICLYLLVFLDCQLLQLHLWNILTNNNKNKFKELTSLSFLGSSGQAVSFLLSTFQCLLIFVLYINIMPRVFSCTQLEEWKKVHPIHFPKSGCFKIQRKKKERRKKALQFQNMFLLFHQNQISYCILLQKQTFSNSFSVPRGLKINPVSLFIPQTGIFLF